MLILKPDKPDKNALPLPQSNADAARESGTTLTLADPFDIVPKSISVLRVATGHYTLNVSINTLRKANRLVVTFLGTRPGGKDAADGRRPMFARRHWDAMFRSPILAISDPQTEVELPVSGPRTSFYMGTFAHDLVPEILALVNKVCDELLVPRDKVVLYGAAAGGSAALLVGSRRPEGTGIIVTNPYLRPDKYRDQVIEVAARAAEGDVAAWNKAGEATPWRINPLTALRDGFDEGHDTRLVVAQNLKDKLTINRHFPGLWRRFDVSPEGGVSPNGRVMVMLYDDADDADGHEPPACSRPLAQAAYEFFEKPIEALPRKKKKKPAKATPGAGKAAATDEAGAVDEAAAEE